MTDQRLREAERRWQHQGTLREEADYLLERVRAGDLSSQALRLADYLGHPAARLARQNEAPPAGSNLPSLLDALSAADEGSASERMARKRRRHQAREEIPKFLTGLTEFGDEACLRAAVAVVSELMPQFARSRTPDLLRQAYAATLTWLSSPTEQAAQECRRLADEVRPPHNDSGWKDSAVKLLAWSAADESKRRELAVRSIEDAGLAGRRPLEVLQAIQAELLPWVLGARDAVRERVEARQQEAAGD